MSLRRWYWLWIMSLSVFFATYSPITVAQETKVVLVIAHWEKTENGSVLIIPFSDALTEKQKNMITGGFTTVSQLFVRMPGYSPGDQAGVVFSSQCSVKFDAWEETYEIVRVQSENSKPFVSKEFAEYAKTCLTGDIEDSSITKKFDAQGGYLQAQLILKQTSADEALKIKDWLIQQQSGVMQGLFSHMLGDISLHQTHMVNIKIPKLTENTELPHNPGPSKETPKKGRG